MDGSLSAKEPRKLLDRPTGQWHKPQPDRLIGGMTGHSLVIRQERQPLAVWRRVREPIVELIGRDLFLLRAVGFHSPDLHTPGAFGIEIEPVAVRRVVRAVIESFCISQTFFFTPI